MPPSGFVAGIWGRNDDTRGVHKAPANEVVRGAISLEVQITKNEHDLLNPVGINCLRTFPGRGIRVWGARTLSSDPAWRYLNVRRLFNYLEESILNGTNWVVFEPNDDALWAKIRRTISAFLVNEWRKGALFGLTPDEAFYVKCDRETNPAEGIDAGQVVCQIGVAPGQAGGVRRLPAVPVLRRHQPRRRVVDRPAGQRRGRLRWHETLRSRQLRSATRSALEIDGVVIKSITEVSGLKMEQDVIELKQNGPDGKYNIKKLPGPVEGGRGHPDPPLTDDQSFEKWVKDSQFGKMGDVRKGGAIIVYDYEGTPVKRYKLTNSLAEEPGDRLLEGRRHQRADREARRHLRAARGRVMRRSAAVAALEDDPAGRSNRGPSAPAASPPVADRNRDCGRSSASCCRAATSTRPGRCTATA